MRLLGAGLPPTNGSVVHRRVRDGWDVATVVAEFEVADHAQSLRVAELLFDDERVLTVRVGGRGDRSVYRVDVPRGDPSARRLGAEPAVRAAQALGIDLRFVRIGITRDGLGDPEGDPPPAEAVPWAAKNSTAGP